MLALGRHCPSSSRFVRLPARSIVNHVAQPVLRALSLTAAPTIQRKARRATTSAQSSHLGRYRQIPIAFAAPPGALLTAISCLGAFPTPAACARRQPVNAGVRKPDQNRKSNEVHVASSAAAAV